MKRISILGFFAVAFVFIGAPIYMNQPAHQLFINGNLIGSAQLINGVWAVSLDDFAKALGGNGANLQEAGLTISGGKLATLRPHLQASSSADTVTLSSPRDVATGQASGKRQYKPVRLLKEWSATAPMLTVNGRHFVALSDIVRGFGATFTAPANLPAGVPLNLNFAPSPAASFAVGH